MSKSLQEFLATVTPKAATDLETAFLRLPEEKRGWSPMGTARTPLDILAECALLNDPTEIVLSRSFPTTNNYSAFGNAKTELGKDWNALRIMLHDNAARFVATIRNVPNEDLGIEIQFPWGPSTLAEVLAYPYWNMSYHLGQINYIASMLGCLD